MMILNYNKNKSGLFFLLRLVQLLVIIFLLYIISAVFYETLITKELPSDSQNKMDMINEKYGNFGLNHLMFSINVIDEDEEFESEEDKHNEDMYE